MKVWGWVVAAAMSMLAAGAAQAMTSAETVALCAKTGAFGQTFGSAPPAGAAPMMNSVFGEVKGYAPFKDVELVYTPNARKLHTVNVSARYGSETESKAALAALSAAAEADGRFKRDPEADQTDEDATFETADGVILNLFILGPELNLACTDGPLRQRAMDEAMGLVPVTEKPEPPRLVLPPPPAADVCATAESRAVFLNGFEARMQDALAFGSEGSRYGTMLGQWKAGQLKAKKVWTDEDESRFNMALLDDPAFGKLMETSVDDFTGFMAALGDYSAAEDRKDPVGACNAAVRALASLRTMVQHNQAQWDLLAARYDAVARQKGVVLD